MARGGAETRLTCQEQLDLVKLPLPPPGTGAAREGAGETTRYMGRRTAWLPGSDIMATKIQGKQRPMAPVAPRAFGGQVYAQSALAVCRAWREQEDRSGVPEAERLGLHSIHGYFTSPGIHNRPFIYAVSPIAISRAFGTASVIARQPTQPSNNPAGDYFPLEDASLPLGGPCYHAICSFKVPEPDSWGVNVQEDTPQVRFAGILEQRKPQDWPPSPPADIDGVVRLVGDDIVGTFPMVEMRKVDMTAYNRGKPVGARRELVLYRLLAPLPADGAGGWDANAHVAVHGFVVDRNGLLMLGNHVGFGESFGRAASLSYSLVVHTSASEAVMRFDEQDEEGNGWWVQEACFPRAAAGRGVIMSKIWSPRGVHVMTEYQDGLCKGMVDKVKI